MQAVILQTILIQILAAVALAAQILSKIVNQANAQMAEDLEEVLQIAVEAMAKVSAVEIALDKSTNVAAWVDLTETTNVETTKLKIHTTSVKAKVEKEEEIDNFSFSIS